MRDNRDSVRTEVAEITTKYPSGKTTFATSSWGVKAVRSFRSDSFPTTPNSQGQYYQTTNYQALFYVTNSKAGYASWVTSPGTYFEIEVGKTMSGPTEFKWDIGLDANLLPAVPAYILAGARQSILNSVRDSDIDIAQTSGELKETLVGLRDFARDLVRLAMGLTRAGLAFRSHPIRTVRGWLRNWSTAPVGLTKAGAREYLRFMYGVRPILLDVHGYALQISKGLGTKPIGSAYSRQSAFVDLTSFDRSYNGRPWIRHLGKVEVGVEIGLDFYLTNPALFELDRYGLTNPAALVWELTTLSFVVDWFTGLGNFIRAIQQPMGCSARNGYETRFTDANYQIFQRIFAVGSNSYVIVDGSTIGQVNGLAMKRDKTLGFTPPVPYIRVDLNRSQITSLLAILTTFIRR